MDTASFVPVLLAQAAEVATAAATATAPAAATAAGLPWWREGWFLWVLTLLTIAVPTFIAWVLARQLRASDMWARIAAVLVALTAGGVITALGWPPKLGKIGRAHV